MISFLRCVRWLLLGSVVLLTAGDVYADDWSVVPGDGTLQIRLDSKPFATYVYNDAAISRPYFANFFTPSGTKITRNHPPGPDDPQDHEKMHPGMWLAFGDLSGADSWRLAAPVEHLDFTSQPASKGGVLTFAVKNSYLSTDHKELCREECTYEFRALPHGVLVLTNSRFFSDNGDFSFGDQEEQGLGVRLSRSVAVKGKQGGQILNSNDQRNEEEAWGQQAEWCDYSGPAGKEYVGIMIMPHPKNFRRAWCHCRDTGFMAMNPFGRNAFTGGQKSEVRVPKGENFFLGYGVLFHWDKKPGEFDPAAEYKRFLDATTTARLESGVRKSAK